MRVLRPLLLILFCLVSNLIYADTFVVTSNADSGPGTLRDALTQAAANGTTTKDFIYFNLSDLSETGRTINLLSQLPNISSNLVIDGTTQLGTAFGVSNAQVKIVTPVDNSANTIFNAINVSNIEFYGLFLNDFSNTTYPFPNLGVRIGIELYACTNVIIGDVNKGNLIQGFDAYSIYGYQCNGVTLKANVIGLTEKNDLSAYISGHCYFSQCTSVVVGGGTLSEGNTILTEINFDFAQNSTNNNVTIGSNNLDIFVNPVINQIISAGLSQTVTIGTYGIDDATTSPAVLAASASVNLLIENNVAADAGNVFRISACLGLMNFINNYLGVERDGITATDVSHTQGYVGAPIYLASCAAQINIGATDTSQKNFIAYSFEGVVAINSPNVYIRDNEFRCIQPAAYSNDNVSGLLPKVSITSAITQNNQTTVSGTADPGAIIDIYSSESCNYAQCSIRKYIQSVTADNTGKWTSNVFNLTGLFYVSSTINSRTSEYTTVQVNSDSVKVTNLRCDSTASITGLQVPKGISYYWVDQNGNVVSDSLNLVVNKAGKYQLILAGGCITSNVYEIDNDQLVVSAFNLTTVEPSCGNSNGSILGVYAIDPENKIATTYWYDANNKQVTNSLYAANLPAGSYTLKVFTTDGCEKDYGPVTLKNTTGPNIDQTHAKIQSTNCGQSTGSITNLIITGTGTLKYTWWNNQQQTVNTDSILTNQPAGVYKLEVTDDSPCGPVYTTDITIPETNSITIDTTNVTVTPSGCIGFGSVNGIQVTGTTQYQWRDANNNLVGTNINLNAVPPGTYTLTATNSTGCIATSKPYVIKPLPPTVFPVYPYISNNTCPNSATGSITLTVDTLVADIEWYNSQGGSEGIGNSIAGQPAGTYTVYLTDKNGCRSLYNTYTIHNIIPATIQKGSEEITGDQCNLKQGSITSIAVGGGIQPYTYRWTDGNGNAVSTGIDLNNAGAGTYTLTVTDASGCSPATASYTIQNTDSNIPTPSVSNVQLCSSGSALVAVNNASATGTYNLYTSESSTTPAEQSTGGKFRVNVTVSTSYYITQVSGSCESSKAEVNVTVGLSVLNIANTFTPNGDGINDYWKINNIENYPQALVQIFTRYGDKIFESRGYSIPFDGTYKGQKLPAGVYYFIINLNSKCSLLSGSLTIVR